MEFLSKEMFDESMEFAEAIPTRESDEGEYSSYIESGFLSSFLHEDTDSITKTITNLQLKDSINEGDVCDALINVQMADIGSQAKLEAMQTIVNIYAESVEMDEINESSALLEYAGNPEKNKALIKLMSEMESRLQDYYNEIDFVITALDEIAAIIKREAAKGSKANAKDAAFKVKSVYDKVDKKLSSPENKEYIKKYNITFSALKNVCKSFGVKFNDVVMEDKKAFDKKLDAAVKKVKDNKKFTRWLPASNNTTEAITEFNKDLNTLEVDNGDAVGQIVKYVQPVYGYAYNIMMGYIYNINYLRRILGLEKEDTVFYKVLNKIIKTKK